MDAYRALTPDGRRQYGGGRVYWHGGRRGCGKKRWHRYERILVLRILVQYGVLVVCEAVNEDVCVCVNTGDDAAEARDHSAVPAMQRQDGGGRGERWPEIGIARATHIQPGTFAEWLHEDAPEGSGTAKQIGKACSTMAEWGINGVVAEMHEPTPLLRPLNPSIRGRPKRSL